MDNPGSRRPLNFSQDSQRRQAIAAIISRLMSHFWTADDPMEIRKVQAEDWLADLIKFDPDIVNEAAARWRIAQTKRPVIADIFKLCEEVSELRQAPTEWTLPPPRNAGFPSKADRDWLRRKLRTDKGGVGYTALTPDEKLRWHAYDYAFRRLALSTDDSPIDPDRQWVDPDMIRQAEAIYRFDRRDGGRSRPL